jgi:hypothetical protein
MLVLFQPQSKKLDLTGPMVQSTPSVNVNYDTSLYIKGHPERNRKSKVLGSWAKSREIREWKKCHVSGDHCCTASRMIRFGSGFSRSLPRVRCCRRCSGRSTGARTAQPNPCLLAWVGSWPGEMSRCVKLWCWQEADGGQACMARWRTEAERERKGELEEGERRERKSWPGSNRRWGRVRTTRWLGVPVAGYSPEFNPPDRSHASVRQGRRPSNRNKRWVGFLFLQ